MATLRYSIRIKGGAGQTYAQLSSIACSAIRQILVGA